MSQLQNSMFYDVFFSDDDEANQNDDYKLHLKKVLRFKPDSFSHIDEFDLVIFDFETTGLDANRDEIIEIGGLKVSQGKVKEEFSSLIKPSIPLDEAITQITGITSKMLEGQPSFHSIIPNFLEFIDGCILVAHNADFDMSFLRSACDRLGYQIDWPCFCTLKMARAYLPDLESKNLDSLAQYYGLQFEARHRSIGDCKVTSSVLQGLLKTEAANLRTWQDFTPYQSN